jgi:hypothetical protein
MTPMRRVSFSESSHNSVRSLCISFIGRLGGSSYSDREARSKITGARTLDSVPTPSIFLTSLTRGIAQVSRSPLARCTYTNLEQLHVLRSPLKLDCKGHQNIRYRSASESSLGRGGRRSEESRLTRGTNRTNRQVPTPLSLPSCRTRAATQCTSTLRALLRVSISRLRLCPLRTFHQARNFSDIPGVCHSYKPISREF